MLQLTEFEERKIHVHSRYSETFSDSNSYVAMSFLEMQVFEYLQQAATAKRGTSIENPNILQQPFKQVSHANACRRCPCRVSYILRGELG